MIIFNFNSSQTIRKYMNFSTTINFEFEINYSKKFFSNLINRQFSLKNYDAIITNNLKYFQEIFFEIYKKILKYDKRGKVKRSKEISG